jgi:hypothetical protein
MRLAVSPQPQDPMSGPPRAVTFNPTLSLIARQRTRLGGPLKHRHDGAEPSPTNAIVHPSSIERKAVDKRLDSLQASRISCGTRRPA